MTIHQEIFLCPTCNNSLGLSQGECIGPVVKYHCTNCMWAGHIIHHMMEVTPDYDILYDYVPFPGITTKEGIIVKT